MIKLYCDKCGKEIKKDKARMLFDCVFHNDFHYDFEGSPDLDLKHPLLCRKCKKKYNKYINKFFEKRNG